MAETKEKQFGTFWHCHECDKEFEHKEFIEHVKDVHKITEVKGTQQAVMHMDGKDWYKWVFAVEIGGKKFTKTTINKRSREDQSYWE